MFEQQGVARDISSFNSRLLGPHTLLTEGDIRSNYRDRALVPDGEEFLADAAVLVLRLACLLIANGQSTVEVELLLANVCTRLSLRGSVVAIGHREIRAQFGPTGPIHLVSCGQDFKLSKMGDVTLVARHLIAHRPPLPLCLAVLDRVEERAPPFGWIVKLLALEMVCVLAPTAVYGGNYVDMVGGALLAPFVMIVLALAQVVMRSAMHVPTCAWQALLSMLVMLC